MSWATWIPGPPSGVATRWTSDRPLVRALELLGAVLADVRGGQIL